MVANVKPQVIVAKPRWRTEQNSRQADAAELDPALEALADWLDSVFHIPGLGVRFGLDAILGLIPGVGDAFTSLASLYIIHAATRYGVPRVTILRMALNLVIDYFVGAVPLVGDVFDVFWKANQKNVALLRRHVASPREMRQTSRADALFVAAVIAMILLAFVACLGITVVLLGWLAHLVRVAVT